MICGIEYHPEEQDHQGRVLLFLDTTRAQEARSQHYLSNVHDCSLASTYPVITSTRKTCIIRSVAACLCSAVYATFPGASNAVSCGVSSIAAELRCSSVNESFFAPIAASESIMALRSTSVSKAPPDGNLIRRVLSRGRTRFARRESVQGCAIKWKREYVADTEERRAVVDAMNGETSSTGKWAGFARPSGIWS